MPYASTSFGGLFYTVKAGPAVAPTLVLVHGAGGSRLHWPAGLRRMAGAAVITLDLPGHGRSEGKGCETIGGYADAVRDVLEALDVGQAVVVGHSMGGAVAQTLALQRQDRVSMIVLIATGARLRVAPAILKGIRDDFGQVVDLITRYAWSADANSSARELGRGALRDTGPDVLLADFKACDQFDVMDQLSEIEVPALIIGATADQLTPVKYARFLAENIPDARMMTVEGAGHMVMLERPEEVSTAVHRFVTGLH